MYDVQIPGGVWGLNSLAPELRMKVLRQTAAKFIVDGFTMIQYDFYDFDTKVWYKGSACVKICKEFKLDRIHSGTGEKRVLRARFTRGVDSDFKKDDKWTNMGQAQQKAIESYLAREAIIEPFSKLRVAWSGKPDSKPSYIYFFGESDDKLQKSPDWSELYRYEILKVRDKLKTVFDMDLRDQNGELIKTPKGW